jgi:hypothetical protein
MRLITCSFCEKQIANGVMFNSLSVRICRACRDETLTRLKQLGVPLTEANPFIAELCVGSHILESAWWEFYDSVNQTKGLVNRIINPRQRMGLVRIQRNPGPGFWMIESVR